VTGQRDQRRVELVAGLDQAAAVLGGSAAFHLEQRVLRDLESLGHLDRDA
jgi:hypothetical protein